MGTKDIIKQKRIELGLTMKELANNVGVSEATISRWESGNIATMKQTKIALLAQVLGISPTILVSGEIPDTTITQLTPRDERQIAQDLEKMLADLDSQNTMEAMGDTVEDDEDRELLRASLQATMRLAKKIAKEKYTPKKYRQNKE